MRIAEEDEKVNRIVRKIENIKKNMTDSHNNIKRSSKTNKDLQYILDEYRAHQVSEIKQKEKECGALWVLSKYIQDTSKEEETSKQLLQELIKDQQDIIKEIGLVEKQISEIKS